MAVTGVSKLNITLKKTVGYYGSSSLINDLPDTFLVMNGDILTDLNYSNFLAMHDKRDHIFSISAAQRTEAIDYGVLTAENGLLVEMLEKPVKQYLVSMGIYAVNKKVVTFIPKDEYFGFDNLMECLLELKIKVSVIPHDGYWLDIGRPDDYMEAIDFVEQNFDFNFENG